jgi:hypothetical protein
VAYVYEDLFDIEKRPGAGARLWTRAVELQLDRVQDANYRHRLNVSTNEAEQVEDKGAETRLHVDVYFLTLAIRRVLLFHDLLATRVSDGRLADARAVFDAVAPDAKTFRDFYEHLDAYLLDHPSKHVKLTGRTSPVLVSVWEADNVVIAFGDRRLDVTAAGHAAVTLGKATEAVWSDHVDREKAKQPKHETPTDDGVRRMMELRFGVSAVVESVGDGPEVTSGTLLGVNVREMTEAEIAAKATRRPTISGTPHGEAV